MCSVQESSSTSCSLNSLTGTIPFNGTSYKQIVLKNMKGVVNFDFSKTNLKFTEQSRLTSDGPAEADAGEGAGQED